MTKEQRLIMTAAKKAHELVQDLHSRDPGNETFEQVGILNGLETITEFIEHNEQGCALDHLLYVIHESDISFPLDTVRELHKLAVDYNEPTFYRRDNPELTEEQISQIYNLP